MEWDSGLLRRPTSHVPSGGLSHIPYCVFQMDFFNMDPANPMKISGNEDCLFLNIFTQSLPSTDMNTEDPLRPVLFYIHGGGFTMGAGSGGFGT